MENASKALLIAGSVLIAIVLIAVGMRILNSTSGTTDSLETTMNATEIAMFNNKFIGYAGQNIPASKVRSLVNTTIASNATSDSIVCITLNNDSNTTTIDLSTVLSWISEDKQYEVVLNYDDGKWEHTYEPTITGCIWNIRINEM